MSLLDFDDLDPVSSTTNQDGAAGQKVTSASSASADMFDPFAMPASTDEVWYIDDVIDVFTFDVHAS